MPLTVEQRQFLPSMGHLIVTGGIDEGWGEVETSPFLFAAGLGCFDDCQQQVRCQHSVRCADPLQLSFDSLPGSNRC